VVSVLFALLTAFFHTLVKVPGEPVIIRRP